MNKHKFIDLIGTVAFKQLSEETALSQLIILVLGTHVPNVSLIDCLVLNTLSNTFSTPNFVDEFEQFSAQTERLGIAFNGISRADLWHNWLRSHLDERSNEIKLVRGCQKLAKVLTKAIKKHKTCPNLAQLLLKRLDTFCETSDIMQEIFN